MAFYGNERRTTGRLMREFVVEIRGGKGLQKIYSLDFSSDGMKVGAPQLRLAVGEQIEIFLDSNGTKMSFLGQVARQDCTRQIRRVGRDANTFFVKIADDTFTEFVKKNFSV
jgi:hypothetical protein